MFQDMVIDAQAAMGFVLSQTSHIEAEVNRTVYPDIQYPNLIPVDTTAHPWAKTVTYFSSDQFGAAKWITGMGDDIPIAGSERAKHEVNVHMAGVGYGYSFEQLGQAQMLGYPLTAEDAMAARRAYEEHVDTVALTGDTEKGVEGLFNNSSVTAASAATGSWGSATAAQILADVNAALEGQAAGTLYARLANTVVLPESVTQYLATPMSGTSMPVYEYIRQYNIYTMRTRQPLTITSARGLETAGAGSTKRMVAYRRDPEVLKLHIPMPHRFLPPWQRSPTYIEVPGVFRLAGLDIRRPAEVRYIDGL